MTGKLHSCHQPRGAYWKKNGDLVDECREDQDGIFWVVSVDGKLMNQVNYCPYCGAIAPRQIDPEVVNVHKK